MTAALTYLMAFLCLGAASFLLAQSWATGKHQAELSRLTDLLSKPQAVGVPLRTEAIYMPDFLAHRLMRAGWTPTRRMVLACGAGLFLVAMVSWMIAGALAAVLAAMTLLLLGLAVLEYRAAIRIRQISDCMLGFLERVRQLLTIGNSLAVSLDRAVSNSPPIVMEYLKPTLRRIANGGGVADSLELAATELGLYELHLLATAARANLRFGGSLAATLKNIIENIRRRASVERELRANTSQIRASAWVLALLPLLVATMVTLTNPGYSGWFLATEQGHRMMTYAALSQLMGVWCMRKIIRTRY